MRGRRLALVVAPIFLAACVTVTPPTATPGELASPPPTPTPAAPIATSAPGPSPTAVADAFAGPVTGRYLDGLPSRIGDVVVHRDAGALAYAAAQTDATPFLVTGWMYYLNGTYSCPAADPNQGWLHECPSASLYDIAGQRSGEFTGHITFHNLIGMSIFGPVVVVVHVHDPAAAAKCGAFAAACDAMMVADRILWNGDEATAPGPLTADAIANALKTLQSSADVAPYAIGDDDFFCFGGPGAIPYSVPSGHDRRRGVLSFQLMPNAASVSRATDRAPGALGALRANALCGTTNEGATEYRMFIVDNAVFTVQTHHRPTATDKAFLLRLEALLTGAG